MSRYTYRWLGTACVGAALLGTAAFGQAQGFQPDQAVEVREGDEWSAATIVKKEGRKYQIKYADGTEEWLTADRLRAPGDAAGEGDPSAPGAGAGADDAKPAVKRPDAVNFTRGQKLEVKDNARWVTATVVNRRGEWYLVEYEGWRDSREWVEPWRVRKIGSSYDIEGWHSNGRVRNNAGPPTPAPKAAPKPDEKKDPFAPKAYDKPVTEAKADDAEDLLPTGGAGTLTTFDPLPANLKLNKRAYVLKGKPGPGADAPDRMLFNGPHALLSYNGSAGGDTTTLKVERLDLAAGTNLGASDFDPLSNPMAISPTGKRVLGVAHGFFGGTRNRVDLFDLPAASGAPKHVLSFVPYSGEKNDNDVNWAAFVDDDHVLTFSSGGTLTMWDAPKATAQWRMNALRDSVPAMSPGGKQVAIVSSDGLHVIDAATGKTIATIDGSRPARALTFTTDGKRVVGSTGAIVSVWDLAKGELVGDIGVAGDDGTLTAVGPGHVLMGSGNLLDLDRKLTVWRYTDGSKVAGHGGLGWAVVKDGNRTLLATAELPHPAAVKAAAAMGETMR
jgi:hypothetical protein